MIVLSSWSAELDPDVVILDIKMPGLDGIEAASRIADSHDTAVVILTAFSQRDLIDRAVEAGALAYLVKPFQRSELVPAVEVARARHREMRALTDQAQTSDRSTRGPQGDRPGEGCPHRRGRPQREGRLPVHADLAAMSNGARPWPTWPVQVLDEGLRPS